MTDAELVSISQTVLSVNAGLLGVSATLLSLVPAIVAAFRGSDAAFLQNEFAKRTIERGLGLMRVSMLLFAAGSVLGVASFAIRVPFVLVVSASLAVLGLTLTTLAALSLTQVSRVILGRRDL